MDGGRCGCAIRWVAGKWRTSGTQRLVSRRIPARYAALCIPGYGRVPSLCDERVQTEGWRLYNRSSAVVARASVSRGRQANPVLTYETALRRFFAYGGVLRRWGKPMGEATADGGEVAYLRHAEVGVEENPGTLRCALHTGLWKSAVALRRESANRGMTFLQPLFGGRWVMR